MPSSVSRLSSSASSAPGPEMGPQRELNQLSIFEMVRSRVVPEARSHNGLRQGEGHRMAFRAQMLFSRLPCPPLAYLKGGGLLPPAFGECRHRSLARLIAVATVMAITKCLIW